MFNIANLKQKAADAAAKLAADATLAATQAKERIDTAQAGKKMLDEGGEDIKVKLLAKSATQEAYTLDFGFAVDLAKVVSGYREAVFPLEAAAALETEEKKAFNDLADAYRKRAAELENSVMQLKGSPEMASISPAEQDAIGILSAKMKAMGLHENVKSSLSAASESASRGAEEGGLVAKAQEKAKLAADRAKERYGNATAGKKMVDAGGAPVTTKLLAKKASLDATAADGKLILRLSKTVEACQAAEAKLKEAQALPEDAGNEKSAFSMMEATYGIRASELGAVLSMLSPVPDAVENHESERDGIAYLTMQMGLTKAQESASKAVGDVQGRMVEQSMSAAASSATGGAVTKVPEGSGKAAIDFAKENPEAAKAAMSAAAGAAQGGGKGGGYS